MKTLLQVNLPQFAEPDLGTRIQVAAFPKEAAWIPRRLQTRACVLMEYIENANPFHNHSQCCQLTLCEADNVAEIRLQANWQGRDPIFIAGCKEAELPHLDNNTEIKQHLFTNSRAVLQLKPIPEDAADTHDCWQNLPMLDATAFHGFCEHLIANISRNVLRAQEMHLACWGDTQWLSAIGDVVFVS